MRLRLSFALVVLLVTPRVSAAQIIPEGVPPSVILTRAPARDVPIDRVQPDHPVTDKRFWLTAAALNLAMIADTKTTFDVMKRCTACYEADPYARPFVGRGPTVTYTAGEAFDITVMAIAAKMKGSDRPFFRKTWWVVPIALTAGHALAAKHNTGVGR
jgi:hypothetical protein